MSSQMSLDIVRLTINDFNVPIVDFVQVFIKSVVTGMLSTLKGIDEIRSATLSFNGDEVTIIVNDTAVPSNDFVNEFIRNTVAGMVTSLKGVNQIDKLEISIKD
jgi:hypothetical protein